uniref:CHK kinase-like domain-containing protein n=1 Tax=Panagrolaimus sp. PS1159 TaxID=55785 RepID=A0AC35G3M9_9BILA
MSAKFEVHDKLCDTEFTIGWLLDSLGTNDEKFAKSHGHRKISNVSARDISGGKGMFSIVLKCEISFQDSKDEKDIYTTIVKIPGSYVFDEMNEKGGEDAPKAENLNIPEMHTTEVNFYNIFKNKIPKILPTVYFTQLWIPGKHQGCLHMEDLSKRGAGLNFYDCLNHAQIKSIIRGMAYFHKELLCCDEKSWRGKFPIKIEMYENLDRFVEMFSKTFKGYLKNDHQLDQFNSYLNDPKLGNLIRNTKFIKYIVLQSHIDAGIPSTLVHGDLWNNNIIFKRDSNGFISNDVEAFLDWQIVQEGNIVCDFARLLTCSCEGDIRREAETYIFEYFVDCLNSELEKVGNPPVSYTAKQLKEVYESVFIMHMMHPIFMMPLFFATKTSIPEEKTIDEARIDRCILRAFHTCEDAKRYANSGKFDKWIN